MTSKNDTSLTPVVTGIPQIHFFNAWTITRLRKLICDRVGFAEVMTSDGPNSRKSWLMKAQVVTTRGLEALAREETERLIIDMEAERRRRLEEASKKREAQIAHRKRVEGDAKRIAEAAEKQALEELAEIDEMRARKLGEWNQKVRERDLIRRQERQHMRELIAKEEEARTARIITSSAPVVREKRCTKPESDGGENPVKDDSLDITRCTHICELPRFVAKMRRLPDTSRDLYEELMEETNFARSIELAASVYSKKLTAKRP